MSPDQNELYAILSGWAMKGRAPLTYSDLSSVYEEQTGDYVPHHGGWDEALGGLNQRVHVLGAPAISALVVLKKTGQPGNKFWGSALNVPSKPRDPSSKWRSILQEVYSYDWPPSLPPG